VFLSRLSPPPPAELLTPTLLPEGCSCCALVPHHACLPELKAFWAVSPRCLFPSERSENERPQRIHGLLYKYCIAWPDSTPTLSPILERASQAIPTQQVGLSPWWNQSFNPERASQAIPTRARGACRSYGSACGFNPERASQAIPTLIMLLHLYPFLLVSIPNGLPRPFRQYNDENVWRVVYLFQSRTGFPGHSDTILGRMSQHL